ncbi:MAG: DUF4157 domain-containing protein [Cyanobacteria bacterium P01_E01_bin.42]
MRKQSNQATTSKVTPAIQQKAKSNLLARKSQENETIGNEHFGAKAGAMMDNVMGNYGAIAPPPGVQRDLTVGAPGDKFEQEADRISKETVQRLYSSNGSAGSESVGADEGENVRLKPLAYNVQRDGGETGGGEGGGTASKQLEQSISSAKSSGSELPSRDRYENAMGADFSNIKVHTGGESDRLNRSLSSRAFTNQNHIFFKQGEFNPGTRQGDALITHELTHTLQQGAASTVGDVQRSPLQISRASEDWIQRDMEDPLQAYTDFFEGDLAQSKYGVVTGKWLFGKKSETFKLIKKLLVAYDKYKGEPDSYLYLEKVYNLLVLKKVRNEGSDDIGDRNIVKTVELFRKKMGFDVLVQEKYKAYQESIEKGDHSIESGKKDIESEGSNRKRIKGILERSDDPTIDGEERLKEYQSLDQKYSKLIAKKVKSKKLSPDQLSKWAKEFQSVSNKGALRKRGSTLSEVDFFLTRAQEEASQSFDDVDWGQVYDYMKSAVTLMDIWLLKYEPQMKDSLKEMSGKFKSDDTDKLDETMQEVKDKTLSDLASAYKGVFTYRQKMVNMLEMQAKTLDISVDDTKIGLSRPGQGTVNDESTIRKLRQDEVLKKVGKKYSGECGIFFGKIYPFIVNTLAGSMGDKGKVELDVLIPVEPTGTGGLGFHLKIDAERKDDHELKVWNHLLFQGGVAGPSKGIDLKGTAGVGMYYEITGNSSAKVGQLFSYAMYRRFRESRVVPATVTNYLWGGGYIPKSNSEMRASADAWAASVEEETWGYDEQDQKDREKAYVEAGFLTRFAGKAGLKSGIEAKGELMLGMGKRYNQESMEGTGGMKDGMSMKDKKKKWSKGAYKSKGMDSVRVQGEAAGEFPVGNGYIKVSFKPKYEILVDADKSATLGLFGGVLRKEEYEIKFGGGGEITGRELGFFLSGAAFIEWLTKTANDQKAKAHQAAAKKEEEAGTRKSQQVGQAGNTVGKGFFGFTELFNDSDFTMEAGMQLRSKLGWEYPNAKQRTKEQLEAQGKLAGQTKAVAQQGIVIESLKKEDKKLKEREQRDKTLELQQIAKITEAETELEKLKNELKTTKKIAGKWSKQLYSKSKAKGEAHLETYTKGQKKVDVSNMNQDFQDEKDKLLEEGKEKDIGTGKTKFEDEAIAKIASIFQQSSFTFELTHRLVSFKWEEKGKTWAVSSGDDILRGKKRREILGIDKRREEDQ